jgi:putative hydrolase of the HAD superfamily
LLPEHAATPAAARRLALAFFQGFGGDWAEFDRGRIEVGPLAARIADRIGISTAAARRVIEAIPDELQPMPPTVDLLRRLDGAGHALYFLSNMPRPYAHHLETSHEVMRLFRRGLFSSRVGLIKPEPALLALAATTFGASGPAELLLIDDMPGNIEAACAAGWSGVVFDDAVGCVAALERLGLTVPASASSG